MIGEPTGFWAKIKRERNADGCWGEVSSWHSLLDHCYDVTACFQALLSVESFRKRLDQISGLPAGLSDVHLARLSALAFLHDFGKVNGGFQSQAVPSDPRAGAGHCQEAVALLTEPALKRSLIKGSLPLRAMDAWFTQGGLTSMLLAAWSHHGVPMVMAGYPDANNHWQPWKWATIEQGFDLFANALKQNFSLAFKDGEQFTPTPEFQAMFCGLLSMADWIASNDGLDWFPYSEGFNTNRFEWSKNRAVHILNRMGVIASDSKQYLQDNPPDYSTTFGIDNPYPLQREIMNVTLPQAGSLMLIESETGSGKTESAVMWALRLWAAGRIESVYFALPTRTSGIQIHSRVLKAIKSAFGQTAPPCVLAVPGYTRVDDSDAKVLGKFRIQWPEKFKYRGWMAENAKRYLLAPFGVGTIDQVLLSIIRSKHAYMRAACLSRALVIVDEVHASDAYMSRLTRELAIRHVAHGGHCLLMSATLGSKAAGDFLNEQKPNFNAAVNLPYPLIRYQEHGLETQNIVPESSQACKTIRIDVEPIINDNTRVAQLAAQLAFSGARVLVIRNTVAACVETRRALEALLETDAQFQVFGVFAPHHGRFAPEDRKMLDNAVLSRFGKGCVSDPVVLVATQTVEQSLDIDADILLTDLCPIDVLLQRIGRLQRHSRDRPEIAQVPRCIVFSPPEGCLSLAEGKFGKYGLGFERAYEDLLATELTLRVLTDNREIIIPEQNRWLVESCLHWQAQNRLVGEDYKWLIYRDRVMSTNNLSRTVANLAVIDQKVGFGELQSLPWNDDMGTSRLGAANFTAIFSDPLPRSPFDHNKTIRLMPVPAWMLDKNLEENAEPVLLEQMDHGFKFSLGEKVYQYTNDGLSREPANA